MATIPDSGNDPVTVSVPDREFVPTSDLSEIGSVSHDGAFRDDDARPLAERFGKYRVERLLGRGGFGEVYLAKDEELARFVAIKVARPELWKEGEQQRFVEEARRLARLDHPGIVRVYQIDSDAGLTYIVSEYVDGEDLRSWARRCNPGPEKIATLLAALSDAVAFAHSRGIWHRDIKPTNVLVDRSDSPKLIDFGLATDEVAQRTLAGETAGTLPYMSPEQVNGEAHRLDGRSDIWSVGVLLYELLSGSRPFGGDSESSLCDEIRLREPRPLRMIAPRTPPELARICMGCLAKRSIDRYQSAYDLTDDLRHWLKSRSDEALAESSRRAVLRTSGNPYAAILPKGFHSFDEEDADFFLDLLPGPRDREGLPQRVRFWRRRIQERQASETFAVGVMYGPSGCGKSSLVKAGLIPRLGYDVIPLYVEASGSETESRLVEAIRRRCPETSGERLLDLFVQLRRNGGSSGRKTLIVLDQFEQWLHAQGDFDGSELVRALRQCDGGKVQCLVLVRDDFWMPVTRFMRALEIELAEEKNAAAVDLFDEAHATRVLTAFGRAWDRLPPATEELTDDQKAFLSNAVRGLSQDGKVVCVRLTIFAETMKSRPWTVETLASLGGASGVQASFLDQMFQSSNAPPGQRMLAEGAKAVLAALTPDDGVEIRNRTKTHGELFDEYRRALPQYGSQEGFATLLKILSVDLRLIAVANASADEDSVVPERRRYQLTHDFLVPSLREWLDRERRRTWRGRTEALLAERAASWRDKREPRHLVSAIEWISSLIATDVRRLPQDQRDFVGAATRYYVVRLLGVAALLLLLTGSAWLFASDLNRRAAHDRAQSALTQLRHADVERLPAALRAVAEHRAFVERELTESTRSEDFERRWRSALALLPYDATNKETLLEALFDDRIGPQEFAFVLNELKPFEATTLDRAVRRLRESRGSSLRAAAAIAQIDPDDAALSEHAGAANADLFRSPPEESAEWRRLLRPAAARFAADAKERFRTLKEPAELRNAAGAIRTFYTDGVAELVASLPEATVEQAAALIDAVRESAEPKAAESVIREFERLGEKRLGGESREFGAERGLANLAVAAFKLGQVGPLIEILSSDDWALRANGETALSESGITNVELIDALRDARFEDARFGLLSALAERVANVELPEREALIAVVSPLDRDDADAGIHSAARLVLRRLGALDVEAEAVASPVEEGSEVAFPSPGGWFDAQPGLEMIVIESDGRNVAMAAEEVSVAQFRRLDPARSAPASTIEGDSVAAGSLDAYDVVRYCQWLSEQSLPESEWCYLPVAELTRQNLKPVDGYLDRTGYRLPTPEEWRTACLGKETDNVVAEGPRIDARRYAWYLSTSNGELRSTGRLLPNRSGFFDMYGNAREVCATPQGDGLAFVVCGSSARGSTALALAWMETPLTGTVLGSDDSQGLRVARTLKRSRPADDSDRTPEEPR